MRYLTVNGLRCITFQQACQEYGLSGGDQQWHDALNEAAQFQSPETVAHAVRNDLWLWRSGGCSRFMGAASSFSLQRTLCIVILEQTDLTMHLQILRTAYILTL
ncbi:hypothetical protein AVEN_171777-1 [Araneus ventricosus]|uniref:Uncharacterized protein n=1 Tax=Araneus ventricosus TaxID=182803 RepID=A0A4Y2R7N5_ARAVE|nr:hypothetical protein AVEN_171777-1 [Araneus ventricosus]